MKTINWTGARVKALRRKLRIKQEAFGALLNVSRVTVGNWERDELAPAFRHMNALDRLAAAHNVSQEDLG